LTETNKDWPMLDPSKQSTGMSGRCWSDDAGERGGN
jgi:hypothetical protein